MSFASKVLYTGDAVTTDFTVTMPYISQSHVRVYVNEILQLINFDYNWSGSSTISFGTAPNLDAAIEIKRHTSPTATLVDFQNGSVLNESDLDTAYLHNYYLTQEYADSFNEVINEALIRVATSQGIESTDPDEVIMDLVADMLDSANAANLQARIDDIDDNAEAIITLGEGLQIQINTLASGVAAAVWIQAEAPVPGVDGVPNPIPEGSRWYDSDDNNHPYIYQSSAWYSIDDPRIGNNAADITVLQVETGDNAAAIVAEALVRSNADTATASELHLIGAQNVGETAFIIDLDTAHVGVGESLASRFSTISADWAASDDTHQAAAEATAASYTDAEITTEQTARANADGAIAGDVTALDARVVIAEADIDGAEAAVIVNAAQIVTDRNTAATATSAVASDVTTLTARVDVTEGNIAGNAAQIITDRGVAATATGAVASDLTTLETEVDGNSASIATHGTSIDGIEAEYGVDLNVNGYVQGFRIINGGTPGANAFVIMADKFAVVDPSGDPAEPEYVPFEISGGKINLRSDVKIDGDLVVTGTINGTALINGTIGSTQIGADAITTTHIGANQITATEILAGAVTATKINVANLAAIDADLGTITAGNITLDTSGYIRGGKSSAVDTTAGFFLGYESGEYQFQIGNGTDFISWDGTDLIIRGDLSIGEYIASTTTELLTADTLRNTTGLSWTEVKKFQINKPGQLRVYWTRDCSSISGGYVSSSEVRVKLDGSVKTTDSFFTTTPVTSSYLLTTTSASQYVTIEITSGERNPTEPVSCGCNVWDVSLRGTIDWGEAVITD